MTAKTATTAADVGASQNANMTPGGRYNSSCWRRHVLLLATALPWVVSGAGVQSDGSTSSYAGGMIYDANNDRIYVTGTTYDSSFGGFGSGTSGDSSTSFCFVAAIDMDDWSFNDASVLDSSSTSTIATCQALGFLAPSTLVVGGNSEADTNGEVMSGFAWLLDRDNLATTIDTELLTPTQSGRVEYPQFIVTQAQSIYSISLASTDTNDNADSITSSTGTPFPNYMTQLKYGSSFDMTVRKLAVEQEEFLGVPTGPLNLVQQWMQEFPIDTSDGNGISPRVYVGGVLIKGGNTLIVAGSTRGMGRGYGNAEGSDEDGFLTLLDLQDGELSSSTGLSNMRIGTAQDDVIMGICDDPLDSNSFYIVGATQGTMEKSKNDPNDNNLSTPSTSLSAFVAKMNLNSLTIQWSRQWGARMSQGDASTQTAVFAAGCSVRGDTLYVAGGVEGGAGLIQGQDILISQGSDDIWVANLNTADGSTEWVQQVGTSEKDSLARHGGVQTDANGNVILYGDTYGSFYRDRISSDTADVFIMELEKDSGLHAPIGQPVAAPTDAPIAPTPPPAPLPTLPPPAFEAIGDQLSGPSYAGGMVYDARNHQAWLTGSTFGDNGDSQCFVTSLSLESGKMLAPIAFGEANTQDACSAIDYSQLEDLIYTVGGTQENGQQLGLLLQLKGGVSTPIGRGTIAIDQAQYPISVISSQEALFVASVASESADATNTPAGDRPNLTSGGIRQYGNHFHTVVQRYKVTSSSSTNNTPNSQAFEEEWYQKWSINQSEESVYTSGMTLAGNGQTLVVVGSTRGTGGPFGDENSQGDMDGFILKVDPTTGELKSDQGFRTSTRLDSSNQKDDWVTNVCNDVFDHDAFYVVGATQGLVRDSTEQSPEGTTHAFIAKVKLESLTAEWLKHFTVSSDSEGGLGQASAYGCAVTNEGNGRNLVYVAGLVEKGATMDNADKTPGADKDDLFIVQLDGGDGTVNWIHQVGTPENEGLAHGGGIAVDDYGNAIVFAETQGGRFYSETPGGSGGSSEDRDFVVFTMAKEDGSYKDLVENGGSTAPPPTPSPIDNNSPDVDVLPDNIAAFQTGPDVGPTYAGGMYYDQFTNSIFVTGATYGSFDGPGIQANEYSSCFFGSISLPKLAWREKETYGTSGAPEACNALSMTTIDGTTKAIIIGSTEEGGILTQLGDGDVVKQYGIALDLQSINGKFQLQGGAVMDQSAVHFPVAITMDDEGTAWIVSMISSDDKVNPSFQKVSTDEFPNLTTGGVLKYGSKYRIVVERYELVSGGTSDEVLEDTMRREWRKPFETADQEAVFVSDLIMTKGGKYLIAVGSTLGSGGADDMDGIMAKIDPKEGTFSSGGKSSRSVAYFSSVSGRDDWILGACADPDDELSFYVVGATQGRMDSSADRKNKDVTVHAVVAKMHVETLTATWTKQFSVTHADGVDSKGAAASAFGCDVINGGGAMYIAGTVENGATVDQGDQKSAGRDDIFVAKLSTRDGNLAWMKQVGSNGDDRIANGGGVKVDANGNAVVYGDTNGSFFRTRTSDGSTEHHSDLFMMIFDKQDGAHSEPIVAPPIDLLPTDTSTPTEWYPNGVSQSRTTLTMISFALAALGVLALGCCCIAMARRRERKRMEAQKTSLFAYLQQFDVEDIDLRKSPPGGWHGTYLHKLAYGINKAEIDGSSRLPDVDRYETAPLTHSSVVRDSLFMDNSAAASLGQDENYELVDGLDGGYDDLEPRSYEDRQSSLRGRVV